MKTIVILMLCWCCVGCSTQQLDTSSSLGKSLFSLDNPIEIQDLSSLMIPNEDKVTTFEHATEIPLEYSIEKANAEFLSALEKMSANNFNALWDTSNFFAVGDYTLYFINHSSMGSSQIYIENQNDERQLLLSVTQSIQSLSFWDKDHLAIEFANLIHYEGFEGAIYLLDLETATLRPLDNGETRRNMSEIYKLYHQKLYHFIESEKSQNLGEAYDVYVQSPDGSYKLILQYAPLVHLNSKRIYYMNSDKTQLYSSDLDGTDNQAVCNFDKPPWGIAVNGKYAYYTNKDKDYVFHLSNNTQKLNCKGKIVYTQDGFYCLNNKGQMNYIEYTGTNHVVASNIPINSTYYLSNNNFYIRLSETGVYYYFKIDANDGSAILLN